MRTVLAVLLLAIPLQADSGLLPRTMEIGQTGKFSAISSAGTVRYYIAEVGSDWLAIRVDTMEREGSDMTIIVRGVPTKGLVDEKRWKPEGEWKVEATEKYKGRTVFMLKPHDPKK